MGQCTKCGDEILNENHNCYSTCDEDCCVEIVKSKCVKHGEDTLEDILNLLNPGDETYNTQCIGGTAVENYTSALQRVITFLCNLNTKVYDLSNITVGGIPGGTDLTADEAINFLIAKIDEEH